MPSSLAFESPFLQFHKPAKYPQNAHAHECIFASSCARGQHSRHAPPPPPATGHKTCARAQTTVAHNISRLYQGLTLAVHCHSPYSTPAYRYPASVRGYPKCSRSDQLRTHARTHASGTPAHLPALSRTWPENQATSKCWQQSSHLLGHERAVAIARLRF